MGETSTNACHSAAAKEDVLSEAPIDKSNNESGSEEGKNQSGGERPPDDDGMSEAVVQFLEKDKLHKKSLFGYLGAMAAGGLASGVAKEIGEKVVDHPPDWVQWFIDNVM
jgi:hypothetical protein